jgi:hypothetical protein
MKTDVFEFTPQGSLLVPHSSTFLIDRPDTPDQTEALRVAFERLQGVSLSGHYSDHSKLLVKIYAELDTPVLRQQIIDAIKSIQPEGDQS